MALSAMSSFNLPQRRKVVQYGKKPTSATSYKIHEDEESDGPPTAASKEREAGKTHRLEGNHAPRKKHTSGGHSSAQSSSLDVYDFPSSDDDSGARDRAPIRQPVTSQRPRQAWKPEGSPKPTRPLQDIFDIPSDDDNGGRKDHGQRRSTSPKARQVKNPEHRLKESKAARDVFDVPEAEASRQVKTKPVNSINHRQPSPKKKLQPSKMTRPMPFPRHNEASVFDFPSSGDETRTPQPRKKAAAVPSITSPVTAKPVPKPIHSKPISSALGKQADNVARRKNELSQADSMAEPSRKKRRVTPARSTSSALDETGTESAGAASRGSSRDRVLRSHSVESDDLMRKSTAPAKHPLPESKPKKELNVKSARRKTPNPILNPPSVAKGLSSPAMLQSIIPSPSSATPKHIPSVPDIMELEEDKTPRGKSAYSQPTEDIAVPSLSQNVSATPKQKQLWRNLLDDSEAVSTVKKLNFSALRLGKDTPEKSLDLESSPQPRPAKRRLIDNLIQSSQRFDDDSSSDMEVDDDLSAQPPRESPGADYRVVSSADKEQRASEERHTSGKSITLPAEPQGLAASSSGVKVTYAKQRSYLEEAVTDDILNIGLLEDDTAPNFGSSSQPRDPFDIGCDESDDGGAGFRSIHELRAAGQNRRIKNELDTLLEDLEQSDLSRSSKRSAMIDLALKLSEPEFKSHFMDMGLSSRLIKNCSKGLADDVILGYAFAAAIGFIIKDDVPQIVFEDVRQSTAITSMLYLLAHDGSIDRISKERGTNMSRIAISSMVSLHRAVRKSNLWEQNPPEFASPRLLVMRDLELLLRGIREGGKEGRLLSPDAPLKILDIGRSALDGATSEPPAVLDLTYLRLALSITRLASLGSVMGKVLHGSALDLLLAIMRPILAKNSPSDEIETLVLQLFLALTNGEERTLAAISAPDLVQPLTSVIEKRFRLISGSISAEQWDVTLNNLNLSLGTMINLCDNSEAARLAIIHDSDDPLVGLLDIFIQNSKRASQADSVQESQVNVAGGFLAVLLGTICQDATIRQKVRARLPNGSLASLTGAVEEFALYNQRVDQIIVDRVGAADDDEEKSELWTDYKEYTQRLRMIAGNLKRYEETGM